MKLLSVPALLILVPILLTQFHLPAAEKDVEPEAVETARAEVIVWFCEDISQEDALKIHVEVLEEAFRGIESETERNGSLHLATFSAEKKVRETVEDYGKFQEVKRAEPNFVSMAEPGEPVRGVSSGIAYTLEDDKITLHWGRKRTGGYSIDIQDMDFECGRVRSRDLVGGTPTW